MAFSEAQRKAIQHDRGPMMVLAGPGSGKTTVITYRIWYLTEELGVNPGDILVITFTRAAAMEMRERYEKLSGKSSRVTFGTFHAVFFQILKLAYRMTGANIVREDRKRQILKELADRCSLEPEDEGDFLNQLEAEISTVKTGRIPLDHYYSASCPDEAFRQIYRGYDGEMRRTGLIDFDDMMVMCYELFTERKDILSAWQKRYRYILIDEFQDIDQLQYDIVRMLALPENNLFIVGDDDQSIYRFRGARPEIMLGFEKDYPGAGRVLLDINYRSTAEIVGAAQLVIRHNQKRFPKTIRSLDVHGKNVLTRVFPNPRAENRAVAEEIRALLEAGEKPAEIAVLYRTNLGPRMLMETMMGYNLPFRTRDQVPNLYDHWIARDIFAYLRLAAGGRRREDFFRIMNRPKRYMSRAAFPGEKVSFFELRQFYADRSYMEQILSDFEYDLKALSRMSPLAAVNYIRQGIGYDRFLEEYAASHRMQASELFEIADEIRESAASYRTVPEWEEHIREYREELLRQASRGKMPQDAVTLATMHSAKGLEFSTVYIIDAVEGVTPHGKAVLADDIEEERRLFYVAMTRAKRNLRICSVRTRFGKPAEVSRFVLEYLPPTDRRKTK